jgi:DNA-binding response OmpR family regulator
MPLPPEVSGSLTLRTTPQSTAASAEPPRAHVLVVDDDADLRAWFKSKLKKGGYRVTLADSGDAALALLMHATFDAMLIDVLMPGRAGHDTVRAWRTLQPDYALPVLFISSKASKSDIAAGLEAGGDDYLTKPLSAEVLLAKLQAVIRARRQLQPR